MPVQTTRVLNQIDSELTVQIVAADGRVLDRLSNDEHHLSGEDGEEAHGDGEHGDESSSLRVPVPGLKTSPLLSLFDSSKTFDAMLDRLQEGFDRERRFVSDAAHELRTPLTAVKGNIEVALSQPRQQEEYIELLDEIRSQVELLVRLSKGLLFMARIDESQGNRLNFTTVDVGELLSSVLDQIRGAAERKQIRLDATLPSDSQIQGDLDLLIRLFLNLLDNAVKFTPRGGLVALSTEVQHSRLCICVKDNGPGIAAEHLPHLFDRFYRVEQDRSHNAEEGGGAGLGLAIAHEIVKAHGGQIRVDSTPHNGTTFSVIFNL